MNESAKRPGDNRYVISYRDAETLERLKKMGIISYLPELHEELRFFFANSKLTHAELEAIEGVTAVRVPRVGSLCREAGKA